MGLVGRDRAKLAALREQCPNSIAIEADVTDAAQVNAAFERVSAELRPPTQVAHCVGSIVLKSAHQLRDEEWNQVLALNLTSAFYVLRAATAMWVRHGLTGSAVFCSSAAGSVGLAHHEAIAAAKAGLEGLVRSAAATYAAKGIRVNAVAPGLVRTPLTSRITQSEGALKASVALHPLKRIGEANEVASALEWFLSPEQSWVTGQVLGVDGGLSRLKALG